MTITNATYKDVALAQVAEATTKTWTFVSNGRPSTRLTEPADNAVPMWELSKPITVNGQTFWVVILDADYAKHDNGWDDAERQEQNWLKRNRIATGPYRVTKSGGKHWLALIPTELCGPLTARTGSNNLDGVDLLTGRVWAERYVWSDTVKPIPVLGQTFLDTWDLLDKQRSSVFTPTDCDLTGWQWAIAKAKAKNFVPHTDGKPVDWSVKGGRETALWSSCLNYASTVRPLMGSDDGTWQAMQWYAEQWLPLVNEPWSQSWDAFLRSNPGLRTEFLAERVTQGHTGTASADHVPPMNGLADVLDAVADFNRRFIYHKNPAMHDVVALWTAHTYAMDKWFTSPRLYINAPQAGVGKSQQARIIQNLSLNGRKVSSGSPAYLFAKVAEHNGATTLLFDEADNIWARGKDTSDLQALINDGWEPGAVVGRGNASEHGITAIEYPAYCPVVISGVKNSRIPATTLSRCIDVRMSLPTGNFPERFVPQKHEQSMQALRDWLEIGTSDIPMHYEPEDDGWGRQWDVWVSLFATADYAGNDWPERVRSAYVSLTTDEVPLSPQQKVLRYVCEYFRTSDINWATPSELADYVNEQDDLFDLDGQRVSYYLTNYDITSRRSNGKRVWHREDVLAAAEGWDLPATQKPSLAVPARPCDGDLPATQKPSLAVPARPCDGDLPATQKPSPATSPVTAVTEVGPSW